ncbi:hypothetical protein [Rheinheimera oceanensis]|uniref:hypothetical protein n=1 Tax=Rheinheimera oceanensis TaxID=2817449 RepID=UPI001BFE1F11|nr:hypothetical protein [Rheinheimera oceanensis]
MALEAGGYAEKLGNRYEANWIAYQLLRLLDEKILSVTVEPLGDDEVGTDVIIENKDTSLEHHQCKVGVGNAEYWSINLLAEKDIIRHAAKQIFREGREFQVVSPLASKQLSDLRDSAINSPSDIEQFYQYQIKTSKERTRAFHDLCKHLELETSNSTDLSKARDFLKRFLVTQYAIDRFSEDQLNDVASRLFAGEPKKLVSFLKHYADNQNKLRSKITSSQLIHDLKEVGFEPKLHLGDGRVVSVLRTLNMSFEESITPYLISDSVIPRPELNEILESTDLNAVTLLMAEAGMGKSALLFELYKKLESTDNVVLAIRLDRVKLEHSADNLGKSLGFAFSPAHTLAKYAGDKKIVLILDQLDAIRWTSAHSDNALFVCKELVRHVIDLRREGTNICIVFASRDFDISEDVALNSWLNSISNQLSKVSISKLPDSAVADLVNQYENFSTLPESKKQTLKIPLWLSIYLSIAKSGGAAPDFTNKLELVKRYWGDRIAEAGRVVDEHQVQQLISELLQLMMKKSRFSIAESSLNNVSLPTLQALKSVGLLTSQNKQISFRHQALFDYQVGIRLFKAALDSQQTLLEEIGDFSQQTLTRREHLKYALSMLLAESQKSYCDTVDLLLKSENIRFHLKYLAFNSLKELKPLKSPGKKLIDEIVASNTLLPYFISITCFGNSEIVRYLTEKGFLYHWLKTSDDEFIGKIIRILQSVADKDPDIVLKTIQPFIGISENWNKNAYGALCWDIEMDSDDMFDIRKHLLNLGCNAGFINWKALASQKPQRALELLEMLLERYREVLGTPGYLSDSKVTKMSERDTFYESDLEWLDKVADKIPQQALALLLAKINSIANTQDEEASQQIWLCRDRYSYYDGPESITHCTFTIIEKAGERLTEQIEVFKETLAPYMSSIHPVINYLLAKLLANFPVNEADTVIAWLLNVPQKKLSCGNPYFEPAWKLPGVLIGKFSPYCSHKLFEQLEETIYRFFSVRPHDQYKWRLEARRRGMYYPYWGELQHFLLPSLAKNRVSAKSLQLIQVLDRKFAKYTDSDFCYAYRSKGGMVTSPLPLGNLLSNASWRKIILCAPEKSNRGTWRQVGKDVVQESSIEQFARSLEHAVVNQPERFARFVLTLPKSIESEYIEWIYYGLSNKDKNKVHESYREGWEQCPTHLLEQVISHFGAEGFEYQVVRIYQNRIADPGWSENSITSLINISKYAKDPELGTLNVKISGAEEDLSLIDVRSLAANAINCCRGVAYSAIGTLYWKDEKYANQLALSLDDAIRDPHPAVKYSALNLLLPLFNYNRPLSHQKFLELCKEDIRMSCAEGSHYFFNDGFAEESSFREDYVALVSRMQNSLLDDVLKEAGKQILARWFFYDMFLSEIENFSNWKFPMRSGAASVVNQFLLENRYNSEIIKILPIYRALANDNEKEMLEKIGRSVNSEKFWVRLDTKHFINVLFQSNAAVYSLWQIFHSMDEYCDRVLDYSEQLLLLIKNVVNSTVVTKNQRHYGLRESDLVKVLQRLYEEASDDENNDAINQCLDIWDYLLSAGVYSAMSATEKIDNGLLH